MHGGYWLSKNLGQFLCRITDCGDFDEVIRQLYKKENSQTGALYSDQWMPDGITEWIQTDSNRSDEILAFLNS